MKICLDAGHGYSTPGKRTPKFADGTFMKEYEFNRVVIAHVERMLNEYEGVETIVTSSDDRDVPLVERVKICNAFKADLFLSQHANAYGYGEWNSAHGITSFVYKLGQNTQSEKTAKRIHNALIKATGLKDRGVKAANFYVVKYTKCPAVLLEGGFMTNKREALLLMSDEYRLLFAKTIVSAVVEEYGLKKKKDIKMNKAIVVGSVIDYPMAEGLAARIKAPIYTKSSLNEVFEGEIILCGASENGVRADKITNLTGANRYETSNNIYNFIKGIKSNNL